MGILSSIMAPELSPVREALELLEKELEDIKKAYKIELEGLKKSLSDINKKLLDTNETISLMENIEIITNRCAPQSAFP